MTPDIPQVQRRIDRGSDACRWRTTLPRGDADRCAQDLIFSEVNRDTVEVLARNGCEVHTPKNQHCCGSLHGHNASSNWPDSWRAGTSTSFRRRSSMHHHERRRLRLSSQALPLPAGCRSALPRPGPALDERARTFMNGWRRSASRPPARSGPALTVTYHESCHLSHGQKVVQQPRQLLRAIPVEVG